MDFDAFHLVTILLIVRLTLWKGNYFCVFLSIPDITSTNEKSVDGNKLCHCGFSHIRTLEDFHHGNKKRTKNNKVIRDPDDSEQIFIPKIIFWIHLCFLYLWCRWWCRNTACGHADMFGKVFGRLYELIIYCDNSNANCTNGKKGYFFSFSNWICTVHTRSHPLHLLNYSRTVSHCFSLQTELFAELVSCRLHSS